MGFKIMAEIPNGAFLVARKIFDSELWLYKPNSWKVIWIYILGHVAHEDNKICRRGEGFFQLQKEIRCIGISTTPDQIKKCIAYLKAALMIRTSRSTRGMLIKVNNYAKYQSLDNYRSTRRSTSEALQKHSDKQEGKQYKNIQSANSSNSQGVKTNMNTYDENKFSDDHEKVLDYNTLEESSVGKEERVKAERAVLNARFEKFYPWILAKLQGHVDYKLEIPSKIHVRKVYNTQAKRGDHQIAEIVGFYLTLEKSKKHPPSIDACFSKDTLNQWKAKTIKSPLFR